MVSAVLVPVEVALQLPATVEALAAGLERGDYATLGAVRLHGCVFPAATVVKIALADVAHCYERGHAGYQLPARRWTRLLADLEQLAALIYREGLPDRQSYQD
jgi:hypothetical protein